MRLRSGILVIGSLYWDSEGGRDRWRQWRLIEAEALRVPVPIRYGRKSKSRGNTYTMVFARLASECNGQGIVVPCRREIRTANDLFMEARWLWAAETKVGVPSDADEVPPLELSGTWGRVAIVLPPGASVSGDILAPWRERYLGCADDALLVNEDGMLEVPWPDVPDARRFDILLATTNHPSEIDPSAESIADAWNKQPDFRNYFDRNQQAGILTFQDSEIKRHLH